VNDSNNSIEYSNDPGMWPSVDESLRTYWVLKDGPKQNISATTSFKETKQMSGKGKLLDTMFVNF
jgi:hypothetical protein